MKKFLIVMLGAIVALSSCQTSELDSFGGDELVSLSLSASIVGESSTTRSDVAYTPGDGTTVDRCILEVYVKGGDLFKREVTTLEDLEASFSLQLVSSQTYEIILWADKSNGDTIDESTDSDNHYNTDSEDGLKAITTSYASYSGNDEARDAFYYATEVEVTTSTKIDAQLTRPFGQINVKTYLTDLPIDLYPKSVKVIYTTSVGDTFNALTGEISSASSATAIEWSESAEVIDGESGLTAEVPYIDLSTDYLLASADEQDLHDFKMVFYDAADDEIYTNENFTNIPVQRNYKTNASGELLTKSGSISVTITPTFADPENNVTVTAKEVTISELATAMDEDTDATVAAYAVTDVVTADGGSGSAATITIPDLTGDAVGSEETTSRSIDLTAGITEGVTLTITTNDSDDATTDPDVVYITVPVGSESSVIIDLPNSTVYVNGSLANLVSTVSSNTLVIEEGASVNGLEVVQGNVEVYGTLKGNVTYTGTADPTPSINIVCYASGDISEANFSADFNIIHIDPSLPVQNTTSYAGYTNITDAISAATAGDVIELAAGEYEENIEITKNITIKGAQADVNGVTRATAGIDPSIESYIKGTITLNSLSEPVADLVVTLNGLYFDEDSYETSTGYCATMFVNTMKSLTVTNCVANSISGILLYREDHYAYPKEQLTVTNNYIVGKSKDDLVGKYDKTLIFLHYVKSAEISGNYFSKASRALHITNTTYVEGTTIYDPESTQLNIYDNTFEDLYDYAIQTPYYSLGKIVINNNKFKKIYSSGALNASPDPDGAINIRGYEYATDGKLSYSYDLTNNEFEDVQSPIFIRTIDYNNSSKALDVNGNVNISNNTINLNTTEGDTYETDAILTCNKTGYAGTIDLSSNTINDMPTDKGIYDYLYLIDNAKVTYGGFTYTAPIYNYTQGAEYDTLADAFSSADADDVIYLMPGEYSETGLTITQSLTIKGVQAGISALDSSRSIDDTTNEAVITGTFSGVGAEDATITFDGLYFLGSSSDGTCKMTINAIKKLEMTNCFANDINQYFLYGDIRTEVKEAVVVTDNKFVGQGVSSLASDSDATHIFIYNVKSMEITDNYLGETSRGVNLTISPACNSTYTSGSTQATIRNNTFNNLRNYGVQTSYYPYGKIIIDTNTFSNIDCGTDNEEEGAINIRGYQASGGDGNLAYEYEITNNIFTDVYSVFLTRLYNVGSSDGLDIGTDKVKITGNTINLDDDTKWILRCDGYDYTGTIDLSSNTINDMPTGKIFSDYLYLLDDAQVEYGDVVYGNGDTYPVYSTISSEAEFKTFAESVNAGYTYVGKTVTLSSGLDLSSYSDWTPIGNGTRDGKTFTGNSFQGVFDGGNNTIANLKITSTTSDDAAVGLFGVVSNGTVKNLNLTGVNINVSDSEMAAAAVGMLTGSDALVDNITVAGSISAKRGNGAIVGRMTVSGTISNCINSATITATGGANVGGIVGVAYYTEVDKDMYITGCTNNGSIISDNGVVGGIVGLSAAHISDCKNTVNITCNGAYGVGGIVAEQKCYGSIKSCTNSGDITNTYNATDVYGTAGIVGWIRYNDNGSNYARQATIEVSNNENSGSISGGNDAGGIVGTCYNFGIINSNVNTADTISSSNFIAGIVGNAQFPDISKSSDYLLYDVTNSIEVKYNVSTTTNFTGTGSCKDDYVYDNSTGTYVTLDGNTNSLD